MHDAEPAPMPPHDMGCSPNDPPRDRQPRRHEEHEEGRRVVGTKGTKCTERYLKTFSPFSPCPLFYFSSSFVLFVSSWFKRLSRGGVRRGWRGCRPRSLGRRQAGGSSTSGCRAPRRGPSPPASPRRGKRGCRAGGRG